MKCMVNWLLASVFLGCVALGGLSGCGEAAELYNCARICEAAGDCADMAGLDLDVTSCIDECEDEADQSAEFAEDAEACQECLDAGEECTAENIPCVDECASVVPALAL